MRDETIHTGVSYFILIKNEDRGYHEVIISVIKMCRE